jgi:hypothetical protein
MDRRGDIYFGSNSPSAVMRSLIFVWLSLVITSIPVHFMLNGIMGYGVTTVDLVEVQSVNESNVSSVDIPSTWANVNAAQCATSLLKSNVFVTDFTNVTIVVKDNVDPSPYNTFFSSNSSGHTFPKAADIVTCYFAYIDSQCEGVVIHWFPLACATATLIIKTVIIFVALHRHSHFRKSIFNLLGDMITVGARYPHLRDNGEISVASAYRPQKNRWVRALGRWDLGGVAIYWWVSALGVTTAGAVRWYQLGVSGRFERYGLGTVTHETSFYYELPDNPNLFPTLVIIANSHQIWLSIGYLLWNTQVTRIWMEREWRSITERFASHAYLRTPTKSASEQLDGYKYIQ